MQGEDGEQSLLPGPAEVHEFASHSQLHRAEQLN